MDFITTIIGIAALLIFFIPIAYDYWKNKKKGNMQ
ncbi:hypothetical protein SAMN06265218_11877 [Fodinibius sediminis]|uniref:Uncharacterized protein n=1 Tax=Fodinibius sediminis TaxID=1214077 RepID=A0A521ES07_9BACT|nr:hypothetical protein SAMN06265218_11877 [Fodinibius sediminis]